MNHLHSRRDALRFAAAGAAAFALSGFAVADEPKKKIPIALELYSLRNQLKTDFPGTIEAVGKMGYVGVEFAGYYGWDKKPTELRKLLDDNGLKCCGTHTQYGTLIGDNLKRTVELHKTLGNTFLICPFMVANSPNEWMEWAKKFNAIAAQLKDDGMFVGYHSHAQDFHKFDDKTAWEIFFDNTNPEVIHQLDTGNCLQGGGDPLAMIKRYPGRTRSTHIKEFGGPPGAVIGEGTIDWKTYLDTYEAVGGTEWYIIEYESTNDPLEKVRLCLENLHKLGR